MLVFQTACSEIKVIENKMIKCDFPELLLSTTRFSLLSSVFQIEISNQTANVQNVQVFDLCFFYKM